MSGTNSATPVWRKSRRSQVGGTECVEVAKVGEGCAVRDSKNTTGPVLSFNDNAWREFLQLVKRGTHDL